MKCQLNVKGLCLQDNGAQLHALRLFCVPREPIKGDWLTLLSIILA